MHHPQYYYLEGKTPVPCRMDDRKRFEYGIGQDVFRVALTPIAPKVEVSTVFLGLDHNWGIGPPLLFETMIFGGVHDEYQERYSIWDEAEAGHARAVALAREACQPVGEVH